ncbi:hypothetical protein XBLMG947_1738 [Xanthomonas bromi]|uniref:Uncharacterized protein n=1 Tax=Xanthomonas bromi TaxID=56449 RepID=A0A1C3NKN9_9XANT|nr:hypothetical protein XBLMG947_1738 [Xanthomonas bromi]
MTDFMTALLLAPSSTTDAPVPSVTCGAGVRGWQRDARSAADAAAERSITQEPSP